MHGTLCMPMAVHKARKMTRIRISPLHFFCAQPFTIQAMGFLIWKCAGPQNLLPGGSFTLERPNIQTMARQ